VDVTNIAPSVEEAVALKQGRALDETALRTIFLEARSANGFLDVPVPRATIERILELASLGPTSANSLPGRFVIVESKEAKERLRPALAPGNLDKTMAAPATVIVAADLNFHENFARTFPTRPEMADRFKGDENAPLRRDFARDNALLQMAYFIIAARACGLDCGPMGGFDKKAVDAEFFPDGRWLTIYLINLGYGDDKTFPRLPRLAPDEIARFI